MATNYPTSLDNGTSLPSPTGSNTQNNPDHASQHSTANDAIKALEAKLGIGSTTPSSTGLFLIPTGAGTTAWSAITSAQLAATLSDETGTGSAVFATTPTLVTPKVDTINENTLNNGVTVAGMNIKSGVIQSASTALGSGTVSSTNLATGVPVQIVSTNYNAVVTGTTVIPSDDTIPQNTEGDQYMTQIITPKSATNRLLIEIDAQLTSNAAPADISMALFQDTTANALAAKTVTYGTTSYIQNLRIVHDMLAGTTSATTFKMRAGANSVNTTTFNGQGGVRRFGGITVSNIKITEYKA